MDASDNTFPFVPEKKKPTRLLIIFTVSINVTKTCASSFQLGAPRGNQRLSTELSIRTSCEARGGQEVSLSLAEETNK
jgi:hypothetical protein